MLKKIMSMLIIASFLTGVDILYAEEFNRTKPAKKAVIKFNGKLITTISFI